jgi:hypothetical protein
MNVSKIFATTLTIAGLSLSGFANASWLADPEVGFPQVDLVHTLSRDTTTRAEIVAALKTANVTEQPSSGWLADPEVGFPQFDRLHREF